MNVFGVIPVKKLDEAKSRLSPLLTNTERKQFCLTMLEDVLRNVKSTKRIDQPVVVSRDPAVRQTAETFAVASLTERTTGLNQAVSMAIGWCTQREATSVLVLPADIPLVRPIDLNRMIMLGERFSMVVSPSRSGRGTNALLLTPPNASPTLYGPDSFQLHLNEAARRGITVTQFRSPQIALDIDTVEDLTEFVTEARGNVKKTSAYRMLDKMRVLDKLSIKASRQNVPL